MVSSILILAGFVLLVVALLWWELRARKRMFARIRVENAKLKGMTIEEYNAWLKSLDDEIYRMRIKQMHDDQGIQNEQEAG